jgi:polyisoprenoid-binding protein YceI
MRRTLLLILAGLGAAANVRAEPVPYRFDPMHSRLFFDWVHQGYSVMLGRFAEFDGELLFDAENPAASSLTVTIAADSVDVFDAELNPRLLTDEFFNVAEYPEIRFVSRRVEPIDPDHFRLVGDITMLGVTKPLTLEVTQNQVGINRQNLMVAGFSGRGRLDRRDFGMNFLADVAGGEIAIRVEIEASPLTEFE